MLGEPFQGDVDVILLLARDAVHADLPVPEGLQQKGWRVSLASKLADISLCRGAVCLLQQLNHVCPANIVAAPQPRQDTELT